MAETVFERIREEIANTQKQRYQFYVLKITFVTGLLGFGAFKVQEIASYYPVLYLVPLVSVFFDFLIMGEHVSIRRLGTFLRLHSNEMKERDFEVFVTQNRDKFITIGLLGFTLLTWIAAFFFLTVAKSKEGSRVGAVEIVWFVGILIAFIVAIFMPSDDWTISTKKADPGNPGPTLQNPSVLFLLCVICVICGRECNSLSVISRTRTSKTRSRPWSREQN